MGCMRIAIFGAGGMGTALALLWSRRNHRVALWGRDPARVATIARDRENARHLAGVALPDSITITSDAAQAAQEAELLVVAVPSSFLRSTLGSIAPALPKSARLLSVVKGIENETFARPSQILLEILGEREFAVLSGPSHAEEFARGLPASVVVAGHAPEFCKTIQLSLNHEHFRVYTNADVVGVELAGALKNVLAIAAGICEGLGFGDNAKAALITRGLAEIARFVVAHGGQPSTLWGLAGVGDVLTTCYSRFGRNRAVGLRVGRGESLETITASMVDVAEGVTTARSLHGLASASGVEMPIAREVYQILFEGKPPAAALRDLMDRPPKVEWP